MKPKSSLRFVSVAMYSLCLSLALAGCTAPASAPSESTSPQPQNTSTPQTTTSADYIGDDKAKTIVLEHAKLVEGDVQFYQSNLEIDDGRAIYEIDFWHGNTKYNYDVDALTGEVLGYGQHEESNAPASSSEYITEDQAKEIALQDAGVNASDTQNLQCKFDLDNGIAEFEIEWNVGVATYEYKLNAVDGSILSRDMD